MSMKARGLAAGAVAAAVIAATAIVLGNGSDPARVNVRLVSANGLRDGTVVKVAGAVVGKIHKLRLEAHDSVVAELDLDRKKVRAVTRGASARVLASNLLGSKYIELFPGDPRRPRVRWIAAARVSYPVDLDQVLDVLDADTRTRLQILLNEAGMAFTGRAGDFNRLLRRLPHAFTAAQQLIEQVTSDNRTLGRAVEHSSRFVSRLSAERAELGRAVDAVQVTTGAVAEHRAALRATLKRAPVTLVTADRFLAELGRTAAPLRPASRAISASASPLSATLDQLPSFRHAAAPTLAQATSAAPLLTRLGAEAVPVVRRSAPVMRSLARVTQSTIPLTRTLDASIDDALGVVEGWARAIQQGDALGHVFRGKAVVSAEAVRMLLEQDALAMSTRRDRRRPGGEKPAIPNAAGRPSQPRPGSDGPRKRALKVPGLPPIQLPLLGPGQPGTDQDRSAVQLLDFLLGS